MSDLTQSPSNEMSLDGPRPKAFEDAVLDFVLELADAQDRCAARIGALPKDDWDIAVFTLQYWITSKPDPEWQAILDRAAHLRGV